ncbi:MAG: biotin transporter BioY [Oscillospiraceae bacterium]|nr:biotin transporter BioY [Oscillospiraceae bacterium]
MNQSKMSIRDMCVISVFVALIVAVSQLAVPLPGGVPMTLQTFIIPFVAAVLGAKKGAIAAFVYVLLGAVGLPVFAGFHGGFHFIIGPTGGYILSYPLMAFIVGFSADRKKLIWLALGLILGSLLNLSMGTIQFALITGSSLQSAFFLAFTPFILIELLKMGLVFVITPIMRKALEKYYIAN